MAIQACNECGASVSSRAAACPSCGNPLGGRLHGVVTTSASGTGKLIGFLLIVAGMITGMTGHAVGGVMFVAGFVVFIAARFKD